MKHLSFTSIYSILDSKALNIWDVQNPNLKPNVSSGTSSSTTGLVKTSDPDTPVLERFKPYILAAQAHSYFTLTVIEEYLE